MRTHVSDKCFRPKSRGLLALALRRVKLFMQGLADFVHEHIEHFIRWHLLHFRQITKDENRWVRKATLPVRHELRR